MYVFRQATCLDTYLSAWANLDMSFDEGSFNYLLIFNRTGCGYSRQNAKALDTGIMLHLLLIAVVTDWPLHKHFNRQSVELEPPPTWTTWLVSRGVYVANQFNKNSFCKWALSLLWLEHLENVSTCWFEAVYIYKRGQTNTNVSGHGVLSMHALSYGVVRVDSENNLAALTLQDCGQVLSGGQSTFLY